MITPMDVETSNRSGLKAGALAGVTAGAAFMMMEMGLAALSGASPWRRRG